MEEDNSKYISVTKVRSGKEFSGMELITFIKGTGKSNNPHIVVFEDKDNHIMRDLIIIDDQLYYSPFYNGFIELDRNNIVYLYPVI